MAFGAKLWATRRLLPVTLGALGFAATENAYYIFNMGYLVNGWQGITQLSVIRILLVGWQHQRELHDRHPTRGLRCACPKPFCLIWMAL